LDRIAQLVADLDLRRPGLEIGPYDRPCVSKRHHPVAYADILDTQSLRAKGQSEGRNPQDIGDVDFVIVPDGLLAAVGERRFGYVIASHVLEHVPDPIGWFGEVHALLQPGGVLSLALPDQRRCFDRLRQPTPVSQWIDAHLSGQRRPSPGNVFDALFNAVNHRGEGSWGDEVAASAVSRITHPLEALRLAREAAVSTAYHDVHCSVQTLDSFLLNLRQLVLLDLFPFVFVSSHETVHEEFFIALRRDDGASWQERMAALPLPRVERYAALPMDFDPRRYLELHADLVAARVDPAEHYLDFGMREGRAYR
jgi:SAM-dependent methyltransferase